MGKAMLSKFLIQFSVDGWGCVPSLFFDLRPNYGGGNEDNGDLFLKVPCMLHSVTPALQQATANPTSQLETPGHSQARLGQSFVQSLLLSPGSWCAKIFSCALHESASLVLCKFCNQIPMASKVKFPGGFSIPLPDPQVGKPVAGPRSFFTVSKFLWYNCSAVCGSSAQWLYGGVNGDLLLEGLCHTQVCCTQSPCPCCRPLLTHTSAGDTETLKVRSGSVFVESSGTNKVLFEPSEHLWWVWGLILNAISPILPSL